MFMSVMLGFQKNKIQLSGYIEQYLDIIANFCIIGCVICVILLIILRKLGKRSKKVYEFRCLFLDALALLIIYDIERGIEPAYSIDDIETCMWSYNKMICRFWVKKYRKMFYDSGLFDYVYNYAHSKSEELKDEVYEDGSGT